ncbi:MAG TPA: diguanylate cyclase [Anaerolineales bacterium]|nr:diguanylate cyclase [Anaerolineales bacterium]
MDKPFALIIEDDRDIAALFRHVLDLAGYRTEIIMHGGEAVERLQAVLPDIVLLDLSLPGVPGSLILEDMRADPVLKNVPVVVVTAHSHIADTLPVEPDLVLLKPVNLDQLSNLVQRLRQPPKSAQEAPWDPTTHLYNRAFFSVRLTYSLERAKQIGVNRFGIVFVDLEPFAGLQRHLGPEKLNAFLREVAAHLKANLRPTDTIARFDAGLFLVLIEDIPDDHMPARLAGRIERDLREFLWHKGMLQDLHAYVGMVSCGASYGSIDEILGDVEIARKLARTEKSQAYYDRDLLVALRGAVY